MPRAGAELLQRLKDETAEAHVAIERSVRFLDPQARFAEYGQYLARLYGFYAPLEDRLLAIGGDVPSLQLPARGKTQLLREDLRALSLSAAAIDALPRCHELPPLDGLQDALGCLYVVEGATLGGRYVHKRLSELFPDELPRAARFLRAYGAATGERWRDFGAALAAEARDPDRIVAAARATFTALHRWLASGPRPQR